ncbi:MAG: hypothetical protein AB2792_13735 [Candidatus Thiodiazotropha sp.]
MPRFVFGKERMASSYGDRRILLGKSLHIIHYEYGFSDVAIVT